MSKHTPGPWKIGGGLIYAEGVNAPVEIGTAHSYCRDNFRRHSPAQTIADSNARLIAAAPELLEVLEAICELDQDYTEYSLTDLRNAVSQYKGAARSAIAKAEGRE